MTKHSPVILKLQNYWKILKKDFLGTTCRDMSGSNTRLHTSVLPVAKALKSEVLEMKY